MIEGLSRGGFRDAFERKAPHEALLRRTPTWVVVNPEPALFGLALIATHPERFVFEAQRLDRA
jgi:glucokinase